MHKNNIHFQTYTYIRFKTGFSRNGLYICISLSCWPLTPHNHTSSLKAKDSHLKRCHSNWGCLLGKAWSLFETLNTQQWSQSLQQQCWRHTQSDSSRKSKLWTKKKKDQISTPCFFWSQKRRCKKRKKNLRCYLWWANQEHLSGWGRWWHL